MNTAIVSRDGITHLSNQRLRDNLSKRHKCQINETDFKQNEFNLKHFFFMERPHLDSKRKKPNRTARSAGVRFHCCRFLLTLTTWNIFFLYQKANVCLGFRSFFCCCCFTVSPCGFGNFLLLFFRTHPRRHTSSHGLRPQPQFLHFHSIVIFLFKTKNQIET